VIITDAQSSPNGHALSSRVRETGGSDDLRRARRAARRDGRKRGRKGKARSAEPRGRVPRADSSTAGDPLAIARTGRGSGPRAV
jgi:hypothetical protein